MRKKILTVVSHPLISGSGLVFIAGFAANVLNYFFNLAMGRFLTKEEYGLMYSLASAVGFFSIIQGTLGGIYTRYSAQYHAKNDIENSRKLFWAGLKLQAIVSIILFAIVIIFSPAIVKFLHVNDIVLIYLLSLYVLFSSLYTLPNAILQGQLHIRLYSIGTVLGPVIKLGLGILFVLMGYSLYGVFGAFIFSALIPFIFLVIAFISNVGFKIGDFSIRELLKEVRGYSGGYLLASLGFSIFSFGDILLVRHFLPELSGQYAALSIMGKAIFYFISPVYIVFFPLIAQKKEKKEKLLGTLLLACLVIIITSIGMSFVYFLFPSLIVKFFFPNPEYEILENFLGIYSLFILIFSLASLFHNYFLSIGRTGIYKITLSASVLLILGVSFYHQSLYQIIGVLFMSTFVLLGAYLIYYMLYERN